MDTEVDKRVLDLRKKNEEALRASQVSDTKATESLLQAAERIERLAAKLGSNPE